MRPRGRKLLSISDGGRRLAIQALRRRCGTELCCGRVLTTTAVREAEVSTLAGESTTSQLGHTGENDAKVPRVTVCVRSSPLKPGSMRVGTLVPILPSSTSTTVDTRLPSHYRSYSTNGMTEVAPPPSSTSTSTFYDLKAPLPGGNDFNFDDLKGKVVLVVNVASQCGFTPQYKGLEALHQKYKDQGLVLIGFPCNQFGGQEPGTDEEIGQFCQLNHGVTFPLVKKSDVNGDNTNQVFQWLKDQKAGILGLTRIKWNFEKFLVDKQGNVRNRWASTTTPEAIDEEIEKLLNE